jgi:hypothetical protein
MHCEGTIMNECGGCARANNSTVMAKKPLNKNHAFSSY